LLINSNDFSKASQVSKPSVTQAIHDGRLIRGADGKLDTDDPLNREYIALHIEAAALRAAGKQTKAVTPEPPQVPEGLEPETSDNALRLSVRIAGEWYLVERHVFEKDGAEGDVLVGPVPRRLRVSFDDPSPVVYDDATDEELESFCDCGPKARALVMEQHRGSL
jgi:hypothetical protein